MPPWPWSNAVVGGGRLLRIGIAVTVALAGFAGRRAPRERVIALAVEVAPAADPALVLEVREAWLMPGPTLSVATDRS